MGSAAWMASWLELQRVARRTQKDQREHDASPPFRPWPGGPGTGSRMWGCALENHAVCSPLIETGGARTRRVCRLQPVRHWCPVLARAVSRAVPVRGPGARHPRARLVKPFRDVPRGIGLWSARTRSGRIGKCGCSPNCASCSSWRSSSWGSSSCCSPGRCRLAVSAMVGPAIAAGQVSRPLEACGRADNEAFELFDDCRPVALRGSEALSVTISDQGRHPDDGPVRRAK